MPNVNMYACWEFPTRVVTYIQGMPMPKPSMRPTMTARPMLSSSISASSAPISTASSMTNATIVASMSVRADSKLRMARVSRDMFMCFTSPNTMAELLPPTMLPSNMLSSHPQSSK